MILWDISVIAFCKLVYWVLRKSGRHGAALPGLLAEKLNPGLISKLNQLPEGLIVVSGTNGKTTTTHLLSESLKRMDKKVLTNHSGSNMTRGILASIIRFGSLTGRLNYDIAVLEIDEAYAAKLAPILVPKACILTNVLRDQLDRFGEIDHTAKLLGTLADNTSKIVVYNAADSRLRKLHNSKAKAKYISYGFASELKNHFPDDDSLYGSDTRDLPKKFNYELKSKIANKITIKCDEARADIDVSMLPGWHNALNLTAVYALLNTLYPTVDLKVFNLLSPPYGRGEVIKIGDKSYILQLVKNPGGFRTAMDVSADLPALIVINDFIADGRDVSWLWDVDMNPLSSRPNLATAGTRAYDMAVRLQYSELKLDFIETDLAAAVTKFVDLHSRGVIFLTYTAMLKVRKIMKSMENK